MLTRHQNLRYYNCDTKITPKQQKRKGVVVMGFSKYTLRLPIPLKSKLTDTSQNIGISLNALILQILWDFVNNPDKKQVTI